MSAAGSADVSLRARTEELCRVEDATVAPLVHEPNDKEWDIPDA